jgi:hypothetical protein
MYLDKIAIIVGIGLVTFMVLSFIVKYFIRNKE